MAENQVERRYFYAVAAEPQQQAVFLGNAVETPRIIRGTVRQAESLPHPMAAPWAGIKQRHEGERPPAAGRQAAAEWVAGNDFRGLRVVGVEQEIEASEEAGFQTVGSPPVEEKPAFVL